MHGGVQFSAIMACQFVENRISTFGNTDLRLMNALQSAWISASSIFIVPNWVHVDRLQWLSDDCLSRRVL